MNAPRNPIDLRRLRPSVVSSSLSPASLLGLTARSTSISAQSSSSGTSSTASASASSASDNPDGSAGDGAGSDMSFSVPRTVPSFGNPSQRRREDALWAAARGGGRLPMYKDKPFGYAYADGGSWRGGRGGLFRRRRRVMLALLAAGLIFGAFWLTGWFSSGDGRRKDVGEGKSSWSWSRGKDAEGKGKGGIDWGKRRDRVVEAFKLSWSAYERHAWGMDEFHPVSKDGRYMAPKGLGWIIVDSLDTMILMNLTTELVHARQWIDRNLTYDQDQDVNTFETTIRMLGGLLSAHYLSTEYPDMAPIPDDDPGTPGEDLYLEKAKDLADRLMVAFESPSGVPYASVNLGQLKGIQSHDTQGASSTAEATTVQLELKYLSKLTGEKFYWDRAEKVMQVVDDNGRKDGLLPIYISPVTGQFVGENIRLGSRGDSYYEYLIKQYLQTSQEETVYEDMWNEALKGVRKHLVTYTSPSGFTIVGERPSGLSEPISPKMDHLVCFLPGTIALAVTGGLTEAEARKLPTWSKRRERDLLLARELTKTCWGMYRYMATGLAAEITYFNLSHPPLKDGDDHPLPPEDFDPSPDAEWRKDFSVKPFDSHNLQRPETIESFFYMWRITQDEKYREWGWEMFEAFMNYTAVEDGGGFTSLQNANVVPPQFKDNMESFWLVCLIFVPALVCLEQLTPMQAETLKYFYLLFSPDDLLPLDKIVFNTEAHPFPRFKMGQLFSTGWKRKPRDLEGNIIKQKLGSDI